MKLVRFAIGIALVIAISPAGLLGQESDRRRKPDAAKTDEKPATEKSPSDKSSAEKPARDRGERDKRPGTVAATKVPIEEQLQRTSEGKIRFNFQGQPWPAILQWLAQSSKLTLDWQELPEDNLNLSTQTSYTLDEARDLLNMHLAARGFTLLRRGEVLALVKLDKLNPALVPRVDPDELESRDRHEIVRVSFPLDWLVAEDAVKEFEPMKSPFGKLTPMSATNRLEALDTVENLRQIHELLRREQSAHGEERLVVEFKLEHVRAEDILDKLNTLVGAHSNLLRPQDRARMQFMRMREQNGGDKNRNENTRQPQQRQEQEVHLVINEKENSILANAPPDKLAVVRQAVQALDVPSAAHSRFSDTATRMKIYRTKAIDPEAMQDLIEDLVETGKLAKNTQVQSDDNSNTLIVYASPVDHLAIANLVSQIDDDGRDVRIVKLRQLAPDYALQAIQSLLKGTESAGESRWGRRRGGDSGEDQFRIEADLERSQLLLWANDEEFVQVQSLLAKLGEGGQSSTARGNIRVLSVPGGASQQALEDLKRIWPNLRTNPLNIEDLEKSPVRESARQPGSRRSARSQTAPTDRTAIKDPDDATKAPALPRRTHVAAPITFAVAELASDDGAAQDAEPANAEEPNNAEKAPVAGSSDAARDRLESESANDAPSINITEGPGGQLIITSQDVEALDAVETLIQQILPKKADYEVFRLKHASPYSVQLTLEQILGIDQAPYGRSSGLSASAPPTLRFISDIDTGTLLVQGATAEQLQKIEGLIELYDQPETLEKEQQRKTEIYEVKYSHAEAVAEVVKEVYRDLLSSNDKTFTRERKEGEGSSRDLGYGVNYGSRIPQFKGLLSIGVEEKSNTLVISAPAFLMEDVMGLIRDVDQRAASHKVKVVQLNGVGPAALRGVLSQIPGVTTSGTRTGGGTTGVGTPPNSASPTAVIQGRSSTESRGESRDRGRIGGDRPRGDGERGGPSFNRRGGNRD
ncbi:MAG: secretin N-terminal domain-containing protein [Pirellulales bacterium]